MKESVLGLPGVGRTNNWGKATEEVKNNAGNINKFFIIKTPLVDVGSPNLRKQIYEENSTCK